eukprot:jgi/Hompol1/227/HPOL_000682-RA
MDQVDVKQLNISGGSNRFKFQSFSERIQHIKLDAIHKVARASELSEDVESFFKEALDKWSELNCTANFTLCVRDLQPHAESLMQILYHKKKIAAIIVRHLSVPQTQAAVPILHLIVALAKDLQEEFYPHFPSLFKAIVAVAATTSHPQLVEAVFNTMAYLFKYLSKQLIEDIEQTFSLMIPVFRHNKLFVRSFSAESFGFLLRKVREGTAQTKVFSYIISSLFKNETNIYLESISLVFFETIKQVKNAFHSRAPQNLEIITKIALAKAEQRKNEAPIRMLDKLFVLTGHYGTKETMADIWDSVLSHTASAIDDASILPDATAPKTARTALVKLFGVLIEYAPMEEALLRGRLTLEALCTSSDIDLGFALFSNLSVRKYAHFAKFVFPYALCFVQHAWTAHPIRCIQFLATLFKSEFANISNQISHTLKDKYGFVRFSETDVFSRKSGAAVSQSFTKDIADALLAFIGKHAVFESGTVVDTEKDAKTCGILFAAITTIAQISAPHDKVIEVLKSVICAVHSAIVTRSTIQMQGNLADGDHHEMLKSLAGTAMVALCERAVRVSAPLVGLWSLFMTDMLPIAQTSHTLLDGIATYVESVAKNGDGSGKLPSKSSPLSSSALPAVFDILESNIGSVFTKVRINSLRILCAFDQIPFRPIKDVSLHGPCTLFQICLDIDRTPNTVATFREKTIHLRRIETLVNSNAMPAMYERVAARFACSQLAVNFAPLWPEAIKTLVIVAHTDAKRFWTVFSELFMTVKDADRIEQVQFGLASDDNDQTHENDDDNEDEDDGDADINQQQSNKRRRDSAKSDKGGKYGKRVLFECSNVSKLNKSWKATIRSVEHPVKAMLTMLVDATQSDHDRIDWKTVQFKPRA